MAGPVELDSARRRRDLSLVLRRRLTLYAGVGAVGLTAAFTLLAATTIPGKSTPTTEVPAATQDPSVNLPSAGGQPAFNVPTELPQSGFPGRPAAISGGS